MKTIVVITGPTASGKTAFAIECARRFNGEIISCDSMQIYKNLNIGTAKPTQFEQSLVKHHLIDIVQPSEEFSVQKFKFLAKNAIDDILSRGKIPFVVGGTGLYIKALLHPYTFASSAKDEKVREHFKQILNEHGKDYLYNLLLKTDEDSAKKIHPNDTKRVIRALEICSISGQKKSVLNNEGKISSDYNYLIFVLNPNREALYEKINLRVDKMFEEGLVEELSTVLKQGFVCRQNQSMQAIGYKELFDYFDGKISIDDAKNLIKQHTRNYAKRQITFCKSFKDAIWINSDEDGQKATNQIQNFLTNNLKQ